MDNSAIELVGGPCGHHGPYTFYKAFKYSKNGSQRIISLCEFFFVKLWSDSDLVCIGELQLLWVDKNSEQMLASLRLYFLPENTPEGRMDHGEDEVLAITEKVVLRLEDLLTWITIDTEWSWGRSAFWDREVNETQTSEEDDETPLDKATPLTDSALDFSDVEKERKLLAEKDESNSPSENNNRPSVIVLSYPRYCRYRALMKRLEGVESRWLRHSLVVALGGFAAPSKNTRVLFCRDTFDYPDLEGHELLCNHLAPKLKGRPRGKRKKRSISPGGSESNESEASVSVATSANVKTRLTTAGGRNGLRCNSTTSPRRSTRNTENSEERDFLNKLHAFMKSHRTPIGRVPSIGYKEIDLFALFNKVQKLGGYDSCTANRLWKSIFDELGGHHNSTSAATIMRRHYERLLLSYERHIKGEEYKPLPVSERRRLKSKTSSFSDAETSENDRSSSGKSTPVPSAIPSAATPTTPSTPTEFKEFSVPEKAKSEGKTSSLRSVRVKSDRQKDKPLPSKSSTPPTLQPPTVEKTVIPAAAAANASSLPEKNSSNIPVTTAVAPVVEKTVPEKSASPLEGKENIPVMNMTETSVEQTRTEPDDDDDVIEVPYKPKTPEIIVLDADPEPSLTITSSSTTLYDYDVKKRKLDILKEGGLEVTAITGYADTSKERESIKDNRASVIQHSIIPQNVSKAELGNLSITVTSDSRRMPPPVPFQRSQSPKKSNSFISRPIAGTEPSQAARLSPAVDVRLISNKYSTPLGSPSSSSTIPAAATSTTSIAPKILNGTTPPKVLQSRSIYSYSERTVYGNPKDSFMPPPQTPQTPRHLMRSPARPTGGEVLDLTVKSPQKPVVQIVKVPSRVTVKEQLAKAGCLRPNHTLPSGVSLIDARVGSNLEITLVSGNGSKRESTSQKSAPVVPKVTLNSSQNNQRSSQKRSSSGRFVNNKHMHENGRLPISEYPPTNHHHNHNHNISPSSKNGTANLVIPSPHNTGGNGRTNDQLKHESNAQKHHMHQQQVNAAAANPFLSPLFPGYLSQYAAAAASKSSPYYPVNDPLVYYSALAQAQGLYPPAGAPMFPPVPSVDQLQLYKELMAHSARGRYPFPLPPDALNSMSITANGQTADNPNLMKK